MTIKCVVASACRLGESPVWSQRHQALYWLDIALDTRLFEWRAEGGSVQSWALGELASALTLSRAGQVIVLGASGISRFERESAALQEVRPAPFPMTRIRFNDCGCDHAGRLWTGTMWNDLRNEPSASGPATASDRPGILCRFDADGSCHTLAHGVGCPNTFAWSPDNTIFYSADSATGVLYAYRFDAAAGLICEQRKFAAPADLGVPDGSAVDAQGCLWNARWGAGCVARFAPNGTLLEVMPIPADHVTSCAFGGRNLDTLFVTTARFGLNESQLAGQPLAGGVFSFEPDVPGIAPAEFADPSVSAR